MTQEEIYQGLHKRIGEVIEEAITPQGVIMSDFTKRKIFDYVIKPFDRKREGKILVDRYKGVKVFTSPEIEKGKFLLFSESLSFKSTL